MLGSIGLFAPESNIMVFDHTIYYDTLKVDQLDRLWLASCYVESRFNNHAVNEKEGAHGIVQIRQVRLDDYYKRTGKRYTLTDCFNVEISKEIWYYYAEQVHAAHDYCTIARSWNGSGPMTWDYWDKIEEALKTII
jgi:hypothetical protein